MPRPPIFTHGTVTRSVKIPVELYDRVDAFLASQRGDGPNFSDIIRMGIESYLEKQTPAVQVPILESKVRYSKALQARKALEVLRNEIGSQTWIERAIISCDAIDAGHKTDSGGRPVSNQTKQAKTWKELGL